MRDTRRRVFQPKPQDMSSWRGTNGHAGQGHSVEAVTQAVPKVLVLHEDVGPRVWLAATIIKQQAVAFGSPSEARRIGAAAVDEHDDALRRLADS